MNQMIGISQIMHYRGNEPSLKHERAYIYNKQTYGRLPHSIILSLIVRTDVPLAFINFSTILVDLCALNSMHFPSTFS